MFSLVTACMNREQHLRTSLPHWLRLPDIGEIIIVDWSNRSCLNELINWDPRIRIIRVEEEPKWILSYAYNVGIAAATQPFVLKCDSDCMPAAAVTKLRPGPNSFFAGYWRAGAAVGKPSVNGQCIFAKAQFEAVNGYSEVIRSYGRDDEDFYERLIASGYARNEISPALLEFIEHTDGDRLANQITDTGASGLGAILRLPTYNEMHNAFLAQAMPWNQSCRRAAYQTLKTEERRTVLRRDRSGEIPIPAGIKADAHLFSLRYVASQFAGVPMIAVQKLDERACLALIAARQQPRSRAASAVA